MAEYLEVIEWFDPSGERIVSRIPSEGSASIKFGAQLTVRDSQAALFFRDGRGLDVIGPGRHTLSTKNLPVLTKMLSLPFGFESPFRCEIYFVNLKVFTNMRWGTKDPVVFKDSELGLVRLRAFGAFTMQVTQPLLFLNTLVGTVSTFETDHVEDYLRAVIVSRLNDYLGETVDSLFHLPQHYDEMASAVQERLTLDFEKYGMRLVDFYINRITPPEDVQKMIDDRAGMAAVGDLENFLKFKMAKAVGDSAAGSSVSGGGAAAGLGVGVGAGLGMMLPGMVFEREGKVILAQTPIAEGQSVQCPKCHSKIFSDSRFCAHCGTQLVISRKCPRCSENLTVDANYCASCGQDLRLQLRCPKCRIALPPGTHFCFNCGEELATNKESKEYEK